MNRISNFEAARQNSLCWVRCFPLGFSSGTHISMYSPLEIASPRCLLCTSVWMGKVKTKWDDTGAITCVKCVSCSLCHMQDGHYKIMGGGGCLEAPLHCAVSISFLILPKIFISCLDDCTFFVSKIFLNTSLYIQCYLEKPVFKEQGGSLRTYIFFNCLTRKLWSCFLFW